MELTSKSKSENTCRELQTTNPAPILSESENLYEVLNISRKASQEDIIRAYRKIMFANHPDHKPGPNGIRLAQKANIAYHILSDPKTRKKYNIELDRKGGFFSLGWWKSFFTDWTWTRVVQTLLSTVGFLVGTALAFVPSQQPTAVAILIGVCSGIFAGAGMQGLIYSSSEECLNSNSPWTEYGRQLAIGAVVGGISGGVTECVVPVGKALGSCVTNLGLKYAPDATPKILNAAKKAVAITWERVPKSKVIISAKGAKFIATGLVGAVTANVTELFIRPLLDPNTSFPGLKKSSSELRYKCRIWSIYWCIVWDRL